MGDEHFLGVGFHPDAYDAYPAITHSGRGTCLPQANSRVSQSGIMAICTSAAGTLERNATGRASWSSVGRGKKGIFGVGGLLYALGFRRSERLPRLIVAVAVGRVRQLDSPRQRGASDDKQLDALRWSIRRGKSFGVAKLGGVDRRVDWTRNRRGMSRGAAKRSPFQARTQTKQGVLTRYLDLVQVFLTFIGQRRQDRCQTSREGHGDSALVKSATCASMASG